MTSRVTVVVGMHWGDEGKGKIVHYLAPQYDVVARCQGGSNAGHTVVYEGREYILHSIPVGVLYPGKTAVIGNGNVLILKSLCEEIDYLESAGVDTSNLRISDRAHVTMPYLLEMEAGRASAKRIDTTRKAISDTYAAKMYRIGIRIDDFTYSVEHLEKKIREAVDELRVDGVNPADMAQEQMRLFERIADKTTNTSALVNRFIAEGKSILIEGAQGTLLDIDHGTYPDVTSSNCTAGGAATGLGIPPQKIDEVIGVMKAYVTRVGRGPFLTELGTYESSKKEERLDIDSPEFRELRERVMTGRATDYEIGRYTRTLGNEYGATTKRARRTGWQDLVASRYATSINGINLIAVMKFDVLDGLPNLKVCTHYENGDVTEDSSMPAFMEGWNPVYDELPGWRAKTSSADDFSGLPGETQDYLDYLAEALRVPIRFISANRDTERTIEVI